MGNQQEGVRFGSIASFLAHPSEVRFTPNSDRTADIRNATLSANKRHSRRSKLQFYSITSSARASSDGDTLRPSILAV
jgi:hypothetical protein